MDFTTSMARELRPLGIYSLEPGSLVRCELEAYAAGLELVRQKLDGVLKSALILTAEAPALERYEALAGIAGKPELDIQTRRELLLYRLSVAPYDFNLEGMLGSIRAAGLTAELQEDYEGESLTVTPLEFLDNFVDLDDLKNKVYAMLPAHLEADFNIGGMTWDLFDEADRLWDSLDGQEQSWNQMELYGHLPASQEE